MELLITAYIKPFIVYRTIGTYSHAKFRLINMSEIYDNWERLMAAVVKKQQLWELFHQPSRSPSILSEDSDYSSSFRDLTFDISGPRSSPRSRNSPSKLVLISEFCPAFDVKDVAVASAELLGKGNFGSAYLATMDGGKRFVVKTLKSKGISELNFQRNMKIVGDVWHDNVVALRGYYSSAEGKLMLYDYYSNGSAYSLLHGHMGEKRADVDWQTRVKIAVGAARGIAEIHKQHGGMLVHGNIKASNIFLNQQLYGCVSDFGLTDMTKTTFIPTAQCYAPEVKNTQNVSHASDVYSLGILLLELLTRKTSADVPGGPVAVDLVKLVNSVKSKERAANVFDPDLLKHPSISEQMIKMLQIGIRCVAKSAKKRPKIFEVVKMLEDIVILKRVDRSLDSTSQEELVFLDDVNPIFKLEHLLGASYEFLGIGSFGTSYKATLDNGSIFVVKRLSNMTATFTDFQQHMKLFGRMYHINVGKLKAYYYGRGENFLVYDYYNQGSISVSLHGGVSGISLDWGTRVKIALDAARGVAHIHGQDQKLVLGNIKSQNIFLNGQNHSIISFDAGLAKLMSPTRLSGLVYPGYCAPEVANTGKVSQASDVYSFGVVLLELVRGRAARQFAAYGRAASLAGWVRSVDRSEWTAQVMDMECLRYGNEQAMIQVLQTAMGCVSTVPEHRPTIFEVVKVLEEISRVEPQTILEDALRESSIQSGLKYFLENLLYYHHNERW